MKNQINVEGIRLYAYHGCLPEETKVGGEYIVDVYMVYDFHEAAVKDDLNLTIDYCSVFTICKEEMAIPSKLIEHVGMRIVKRLKSEIKQDANYKVLITKLSPPINGDVRNVSIEIKS